MVRVNEKLPLKPKTLVATGIHWLIGVARFVLIKRTFVVPDTPFDPLKTRLVPDRLKPVISSTPPPPLVV